MAKLVSTRDIEAAAAAGQPEIRLEQGSIITPAARDRARELGVSIQGSGDGRSVPASLPAPKNRAGQFRPVRRVLASGQPSGAPAAAAEPRQIDADRPGYVPRSSLDNLMKIALELGAALWVVKDRLRIVEELLEQKGVLTTDQLERYRPDPEREPAAQARKDAFIEKIYGTIKNNPG